MLPIHAVRVPVLEILIACLVACGGDGGDPGAPGLENESTGGSGGASGAAGAGANMAGSSSSTTAGGGGTAGVVGAGGGGGSSNPGVGKGGAGGTANPGTGGGGGSVPQNILPCDSLGMVGEWQKITPAGADPSSYQGYGVSSLAVDPQNAGTIYMGNSPNEAKPIGIWKSTDCGATWIHVNTGKNGGTCGWEGKQCSEVLDHGRQWTFEIDPVNPQVLYTNNGYGSYDNGLLKSSNGGVDWEQVWPQCSDKKNCWNTKDAVVNKLAPGFLGDVVMDPYDHNHLLIDFHADCSNVPFCIGESKNAGTTWKIIDGDRAMGSAHESRLGFLENSSTWVFIAGAIWRTGDSGASWKKVSDGDGGGQLYRAKDNTFYLGGAHAIHRSPDGITWTALPNSGTIIQGLIGDGTNMYSSSFAAGFKVGDNLQPYVSSSEIDGKTWTPMKSPGMGQGAIQLGIDRGHHVMYSANGGDGFWRVRIQ